MSDLKIELEIRSQQGGDPLMTLYGYNGPNTPVDDQSLCGFADESLTHLARKQGIRQWYEVDDDGRTMLWGNEVEKPELSCWLRPHADGIRVGFLRFHGVIDGVYRFDEYELPLARVMEVLEANIDVVAESCLES